MPGRGGRQPARRPVSSGTISAPAAVALGASEVVEVVEVVEVLVPVVPVVLRKELVDLMQAVVALQLYQEAELQHALQLAAAAVAMALQMVQLADQAVVAVRLERVGQELPFKEIMEAVVQQATQLIGSVAEVVVPVIQAQRQRLQKLDLVDQDLKFPGFLHWLDRR